ncbi:MAG: DUF4157 domain-containing protein [Leptospirales bacterium]
MQKMNIKLKPNSRGSQTKNPSIARLNTSKIPPSAQREYIMHLQRTIGNQAVGRLWKSGWLQAKLNIGPANDKYEQEADRIADQVVSKPDTARGNVTNSSNKEISRTPLADSITPLQREATPEEEPEGQAKLQRKENREDAPKNVESSINASRGGGKPLSASERDFYEPRFGASFAGVKVHNDSNAAQLSRSINARAFTVGNDVYFGANEYSPDTAKGKRLMAHELTHTVQQGGKQGKSSSQAKLQMQESELGVQRIGFTAGAGLVMGAISIGQTIMGPTTGSLTYQSDQISYPSGLKGVKIKKAISTEVAVFRSFGMVTDNETIFKVHGNFSNSYEKANEKNRYMANVYMDLDKTTTYSQSALSFSAKALTTPYGTPQDPKVRFVCRGRFDPAGSGDCMYRAVIEIDQYGNANCVEFKFTNGTGKVYKYDNTGFVIYV